MADIQSASIDKSKIKTRWEEPYVSEAINKSGSVAPRGVYRGFLAKEAATPDKTFRLMIDPTGGGINPDSAFVYWDRTNGFGLVVRDTAEPSFDMSARFTDAGGTEIPAGGEIWWVWASVSYATGVETSGTYHVTLDGVTISDDAVILAKITMNGGDTEIQDSNIDTSVMTLPYPTKREDGAYVANDQYYGFLSGEEAWNIPTSDHKRAMNSATTAPTASNPFVTKADSSDKVLGQPTLFDYTGLSSNKVQLSGKIVYVGKGSTGTANKYLALKDYQDIQTPLRSGTGTLYTVDAIYDSTDNHELNPSSEADSAGFYTNPWVYLSSSYTGNLSVLYTEKETLDTLDQAPASLSSLATMFFKSHVSSILSQAISDSPDSLSNGTLLSQLTSMLGLVNDRIETIHPDTSLSSYELLWRSHGVTSNGNVTPNTVSIYFYNGQIMFLVGGYFSDIDEITSGNATGYVYLFSLGEENIIAISNSLSSGTVFNVDQDDTDWSSYMTTGNAEAGTATEMRMLFQSGRMTSTDRVRAYFGSTDGNTPAFWLTYNAKYSYATDVWARDHSAKDSIAVCINKNGIYFCRRDEGVFGDSWDYDPATGWDSSLRFLSGGDVVNTTRVDPISYGSVYERFVSSCIIQNKQSANDTAGRTLRTVHQLKSTWNTAPTYASVTELLIGSGNSNLASGPSVTAFSTPAADVVGFFVEAVSNTLNAGDEAYFNVRFDIYA